MSIDPDAIAVLGDSLTYANGLGTTWITAALTAQGWANDKIQISGIVGRSTWGGTILPTSQTTIDDWRTAGFDPATWIVALGANNQAATESAAAVLIGDVLAYIGPGRTVHWIGIGFEVQSQCAHGGIYGGFNDALNAYVTNPATEPTLVVHDWNDDSTMRATHSPTIWKDGTHAGENPDTSANGTARHMTNDGYQNYRVPFYTAAVADDVPAAPDHTYTAPPPVLFRRGFDKGPAASPVLAADIALDDTVVAASGTGVATYVLSSGTQAAPVYSADSLRGKSALFSLDNTLSFKRFEYRYAAAVTAFSLRFLFKITVAPSGTLWIEQILSGTTPGPGIVLATISGQAKARLYNGASAVGTSYDANIDINTWYCVEHRGSGTSQFLRVTRLGDGVVLLDSVAGTWNIANTLDTVYFGACNKGGTLDLYLDELSLSSTATYFGSPRWASWWDGTVEHPAVLSWWDGSSESPVDIDYVTA